MKVLVTGGHGLVGHALQTLCTQFDDNVQYLFPTRQDCDLTNAHQVDELFAKTQPDVVVHLAARVGGVYDNLKHNYSFFIDNTKMNTNVLESCRKHSVKKIINILSTCIFPDKGVVYPLTSDQLHNGHPHYSNIGYAYAKRMMHVSSQLLANETEMKVINLIPTNLYGLNDNYNLESAHVIPALIHKAYLSKRAGTPFHIKGNGSAKRQFLFARDLARVIKTFVEKDTKTNPVSCIVAPPPDAEISVSELVDIIVRNMECDSEIVYETKEENGQLKKTVDNTELQRYLPDFKFTSLEEGLRLTCSCFVDNYKDVRK